MKSKFVGFVLAVTVGFLNPLFLNGESKYEKSVSKYDISRSYINYRIDGSKCVQLSEKEKDAIMGDIRSSNFKIVDNSTYWEHSYSLQVFEDKEFTVFEDKEFTVFEDKEFTVFEDKEFTVFEDKEFTVFEDFEECQIEARKRSRGQR